MSGIRININAGATAKESSVTATGSLIHIITDTERSSFGIGCDAALKRAVGKYFGKEPNDAYLHSPTPWGDLYKRYGWSQVQTVLRPVKAQILGIKTKPTIVSINTLKNETKKTTEFCTKISEQVTDTMSTEWSYSGKVSFQQMIEYKFNFLGYALGGETTIGFEFAIGKNETRSKQTSTGIEAGVTVNLDPNESAIVELSASSGTMQVRITYEAYLTGQTAVNYSSGYKGHHFWALSIGEVLGDSNKIKIVEDIEVGYYYQAAVKVKNARTNDEMMFHMAEHQSEHPRDDHQDESSSYDNPDEPPYDDHSDQPPTDDNPDEPSSNAIPD